MGRPSSTALRRRRLLPWVEESVSQVCLVLVLGALLQHANCQPPEVRSTGFAKMEHVRSRFPSFGGFDTHAMHFRSPDASAARAAASSRFLRTATTSRKSVRHGSDSDLVLAKHNSQQGGDGGDMLQEAYASERIRPAAQQQQQQQQQEQDPGVVVDVDDFDPFGGGGAGPPHAPHDAPRLTTAAMGSNRGSASIQLPGGGVNSVTGAPLLSPLHDLFTGARGGGGGSGRGGGGGGRHSSSAAAAAPGSPFDGPTADFHAAPTPIVVMDYSGHHQGRVTDASGVAASSSPTSVGQSSQVHSAPPPPPPPPPPLPGSDSGGSDLAGGFGFGGSGGEGGGGGGLGGSSAVVGSHPSYPLAGLSGNGASKLFGGEELSAFMPSSSIGGGGGGGGGGGSESFGFGAFGGGGAGEAASGGPPLPARPPSM
jgi:hypothetical protein